MNTKQIVEDAVLQHEVFIREKLRQLVGFRFSVIESIINRIEEDTNEKVLLIKSEDQSSSDLDLLLDGEIGNENYFGLFYLKDRAGNFYITEVSY